MTTQCQKDLYFKWLDSIAIISLRIKNIQSLKGRFETIQGLWTMWRYGSFLLFKSVSTIKNRRIKFEINWGVTMWYEGCWNIKNAYTIFKLFYWQDTIRMGRYMGYNVVCSCHY